MKLAIIKWLDSSGFDGWNHTSMMDHARGPLNCLSVGFVGKETDEYIELWPHIAGKPGGVDEQVRGDLTIPRCAITEIQEIEEGSPLGNINFEYP